MTSEKLEVLERELNTVHSTTEKLVAALGSAKRKFEEEENHSSPSEKKIGKLRMEIRGNERKLADLQTLRCQLAQEGLACRYLDIERRQEEERAARAQLSEKEKLFSAQFATAQEKIEAFYRKPSWELNTLRKNLRRMVVEPLKRELEAKLAAAEAELNQARQQADDLASQLETVRSQLSDSGTQEVALKAELEKLLALAETHHRVIQGSPQQIRAALRADPGLTVDRWAAEKLIRKWEEGFVEVLDQTDFLQPDQVVTFVVTDAVIVFWFDTGEVAGSEIMWATAPDHVWSKSHEGLSLKLTAESLEQKRAAQAAQPVGA